MTPTRIIPEARVPYKGNSDMRRLTSIRVLTYRAGELIGVRGLRACGGQWFAYSWEAV